MMELKAANCEKCGAVLAFDATNQVLFCQHCETSYVIELGEADKKTELYRRAEKWLELGDEKKAKECYETITEMDPMENAAWWGLTELIAKHSAGRDRYWDLVECWKKVEKTGVQKYQLEKAVAYVSELLEVYKEEIWRARAFEMAGDYERLLNRKKCLEPWLAKQKERLETMEE